LKLLVLDLEGTLFEKLKIPGESIGSTLWHAIPLALGNEAVQEDLETQRRWQNGEYRSYVDWMKDTVSIHKKHGLTRATFERLIASAKYNRNVPETILRVNRNQYTPVLVSGGFRELALRAQRDLKIEHAFAACEYLFGQDGKIETYNLLPCDYKGKIVFTRMMLDEFGLSASDWMFVGDGKNDVKIAEQAPISVGYRPDPELGAVVQHVIDDFQDLLKFL
jgi:phosphoserine phosphatase